MKRILCVGLCFCGILIFVTMVFSASTENKQQQALVWAQRFYGKEVKIDQGMIYYGQDGKPAVCVFTVLRNAKLNPSPSDILVQVSQARQNRLAGEGLWAEGNATNNRDKINQAYGIITAGWAAMRDDGTYATIVMSAEPGRPYPVKFYEGLPPHYVSSLDAKAIGSQRLKSNQVEVVRYLYGGLFEFFVELKSESQRTIVDLLALDNGMTSADKLLTLFPPTMGAILDQSFSGFGVSELLEPPPPEDEEWYAISGVPDYQTIYHRGCGSTASGCVLGYWDDQGFDRLIDGGDSNYPGSECTGGYWKLIWCELAPAMYYDPNYGVYISDVNEGIDYVTDVVNLYSFNVDNEIWFAQASDDRWTFHNEVEAGYPVVYMVVPNSGFAGYHAVVGFGYYVVYGIEDDTYWRIVKDNSPTTGEYVYYAEADIVGSTYLVTVHPGGSSPKMVDASEISNQPIFSLTNYPNPFNPTTTIAYSLAIESEVSLGIFNISGQLLRRFDFGPQKAGCYTVIWDGNSQQGEKVGSGIYFLELKAGEHRFVRRLSVLK